jgi:hypothetical protein
LGRLDVRTDRRLTHVAEIAERARRAGNALAGHAQCHARRALWADPVPALRAG